jgi:hypothetical protein
MKKIKKLFTNVAITGFMGFLGLSIFSCGGSDQVASPDAAETIIVESRLVFTGTAHNGSAVRLEFFDDYLETVLDGNPYDNGTTPVPLVSVPHTLPFELKITGLTYYEEPVDIHCVKDVYANRVDVNINGSIPNGHQAVYAIGDDGVFYVCDQTLHSNFCAIGAYYGLQGPQDEMDAIKVLPSVTYNPKYTCNGSDDNEYELTLHGEYDESGLSINTSFDIRTGTITGVMSIKKKNYNDKPVVLFVE